MSCWRRTTVLRIPALFLGFVFRGEWEEFLDEHDEEFGLGPGHFGQALCDSYSYDDHSKWVSETTYEPWSRLDLDVYPDIVKTVPGPFLDYCLEEVIPLPDEDITYGEDNCVRLLTQEEKEEYLPLYQELFQDFTMENMDDVHYCRYEWYDGSDAPYYY